ncbi:MAG: NosD domain-containing protein [Eubacteriales bacterium]
MVIKNNEGGKPEMVDLEYCYFTDLFTGLDILTSDVSTIHHCWFAQMVNGIIYHEAGQVMTLHDNCFADLETAVQLGNPIASTLHDNGFAYVSKCFVIENAHETNIHHNVVKNWEQAKGTASCSSFLYLGGTNKNVIINGNIVNNELESHVKTRTIDKQPNGRAFIQIENCTHLIFSENIVDTRQKDCPIKFLNCKHIMQNNNIIQPDF